MDTEKLKQGNDLLAKLNAAQVVLDRWNEATGFNSEGVYTTSKNNYRWIKTSPQTFDIIKALNVAHFTKVVNDLQAEFDSL